MGVSAFQDEAIQPVKEKNILIEILNTNCPEKQGTIITSSKTLVADNLLKGAAWNTFENAEELIKRNLI